MISHAHHDVHVAHFLYMSHFKMYMYYLTTQEKKFGGVFKKKDEKKKLQWDWFSEKSNLSRLIYMEKIL